jgi:predicted phage terminase large subunit-like protein
MDAAKPIDNQEIRRAVLNLSPIQKRRMLKDLILLDYGKAQADFAHYFKAAWPILEPKNQLLPNWHLDLIAEYLTATFKHGMKRLIINMPPRYSKSILATVTFPTWLWIHNPELRFIFSSYSDKLSIKHSVDRRYLMDSPWFQYAWGKNFEITGVPDIKTEFINNHRGHMIATSMLGSVTGKGGDYVIIDDPHNPKMAESEKLRTSTIAAFDQTFVTRLDDKKNGRIVVIMQRLHEKDLTGHLIAKQAGYEHLCLPAEAPRKTIVNFPISKRVIEREAGALLHPEREGPEELKAQKIALGSYAYAGQYDQSPAPRVGGILKRKYWRKYLTPPTKFDEIIQTWDMAFKDLETSDYVVGLVLGRIGADKYLLDMVRDKMGLTASCNAVTALSKRWPLARKKLIEDKANGPAVKDVLRDKISGIVMIVPQGSKSERAAAVEPQCEAGNVWFPDETICPWIDTVIDECAVFPKGDHDDIVDALTQGLIYLESNNTKGTLALGNM